MTMLGRMRVFMRLLRFHHAYVHVIPWSRTTKRAWFERTINRMTRLLLGQNPWHLHCGACGYDLHGLLPHCFTNCVQCPECRKSTHSITQSLV